MVSVLIPLYNGEKVIECCLDSVLSSNFKDYEVLILDDCSDDKSVDRVQRYISENILLLKSNKNIGFVRNICRGIERAGGDIIVLLNMDTVVDVDWLAELIKPFSVEQDIGITGSKIYYMDGVTIQHAGAFLDEIGRSYHIGRGEIDKGQYDDSREVEYVCGASLAFQKKALDAVKGFDQRYSPAYYEEVDFGYRLRRAGYKIIYVPTSKLRHHECYSTASNNSSFFYYISKNRLRFVFKHFTIKKLMFDFMPKEKNFFINNNKNNRQDLLKAYFFTLLKLPEIFFLRLKERNKNVDKDLY